MKTIYLNAGHGSINPSTGKYMTFPTHGKFYEFVGKGYTAYEGQTNRLFASLFQKAMQATGIRVVMVHHAFLDRYNQERIAIANQDYYSTKPEKALWLSWHSNAYGMSAKGASQEPRGYSIFTADGESPADNCAKLIFDEVRKATEQKFKTSFRADYTDQNPDFDIDFEELYYTAMPAVLIENLFFTNYEDAMLLLNKEYQKAVIEATKKAVLQWFNT